MNDKYKNLILWFAMLPLVSAMAAYGLTKRVDMTLLLIALILPISGIGIYKALAASKTPE